METVADFIFLGSKITADGDCSHEIKRCLLLWRKGLTKLDSKLKSRDITLPTKVHLVKAMIFPLVMYGCESCTIKKAEGQGIDAFELWYQRRLESRLDCNEIQPVHSKGNQSWIFIGRTDAETETPVLWPPDVKNWLLGKDPDAGKDWRQEEKGTTEIEMVGWNHWLDGNEFEELWELVMDREAGVLQSMALQRARQSSKSSDWLTKLTESTLFRAFSKKDQITIIFWMINISSFFFL